MNNARIKSALLSWVLVFAMVFTSFQGLSFVSDAAEEKTYTEYTFSDFGILNGTYTTSQTKSNAISSFDGAAFSGKIKLENEKTTSGIVFSNSGVDSESAIKLYPAGGALWLSIPCESTGGVELGWGANDYGFSTADEMFAEPFDVRFTFDALSDGTYKLTATINGKSLSRDCTSALAQNTNFILLASNATVEATSVYSENYTEYTFSDLGFADDTYTVTQMKSNVFNGLDKVALTGKVTFTENAQLVFSKTTDSYETALNLKGAGGALWMESYMGEGSFGIGSNNLNNIVSSLCNERLSLRMMFDKIGTKYRVRLIINEQYVFNQEYGSELNDAIHFGIVAGNGIKLESDTTYMKDYTEYTFSDLGIADGTYTTTKTIQNAFGEYNGIAFTGKAKIGTNSQISFAESNGLNLRCTSETVMWIVNSYKSGQDIGLDFTPDTDGYVKFRVRFDKLVNGYRVLTTINDTATYASYTPMSMSEHLNFTLIPADNSSITVQSVDTSATYTENTFANLGIEAGEYKAATLKALTTLDKQSIVGKIAFTGHTATTGLVLTNTTSGYNQLNLIQNTTNPATIWIQNSTDNLDDDYVDWRALDYASADAFYNSPIKVAMRFDKIDTLYRVIITFQDKVTKVTYCPVADFESNIYFGVWGQETNPIRVCDENDTGYTEYTFSSVGLADGTYISNQFGTLDITTYDKLSFTGNVTFSNAGTEGTNYGFGIVPENSLGGLGISFFNNDCIYLENYAGGNPSYIGISTLGYTKEQLVQTSLKINVRFDKADETSYNVTVTINDTYRMTTTALASNLETYKRIAVKASEIYPCTIASVGTPDTPDTPDTPVEPAEPTQVDFGSFGMDAKQMIRQTVSSTKVPNNATSLDNTDFTGYLRWANQNNEDTFTYGVNSASNGIDFYWGNDALWAFDKTGGRTGDGCFFGASVSDLGLNAPTDEVKVTIKNRYTETGIKLVISMAGTKTVEHTYDVEGYQKYLGSGIRVTSKVGAIAYRSSKDQPFDVATQLDGEGYKRITVADFDGLGYGTYQLEENTSEHSGFYKDAETLDGTYLDVDVRYQNVDTLAYITYGYDLDWDALQLHYNNKDQVYAMGYLTPNKDTPPSAYFMSSYDQTFNLKIAVKAYKYQDKDSYKVRIWMNGVELPEGVITTASKVGNKFVVYTPGTSSIEFVAPEVTTVTQDATAYNLRGYDHTTARNYFVSGNATVMRGNKTINPINHEISTPGDYTIKTYVTSTAYEYVQDVALYILGDVDLNGTAGETADVTALETMLQNSSRITPTTAAQYAADIDNNGVVDKKDLALLNEVKGDSSALVTLLKKYYVPAKTYDYLGGNDVMPIGGYFGPCEITDQGEMVKTYLTDDIYDLIKKSGVNMINHTQNDAGGTATPIQEALKLADKYHLGWFVDDSQLNQNQLDGTLNADKLSSILGKYSYYQSFLGIHIVDEPGYDGEGDYTNRPLGNYTGLSKTLNKFTNVTGFVNMAAEDIFNTKYDSLWATYVKDGAPQLLSSDDYPINNGKNENATKASGYFRTLGITRNQAKANNLPFWSYVQAGGNFENDKDTTDNRYVPTEAETYWNVNTALAFGAKGIVWFPLIQPTNFDGSSIESSIDRNGVLLSNGVKSKFYDWVATANKQIAGVDDVLMKATSTAIVASGGYAESQARGTVSGTTTTTVSEKYGKLQSVNTTRDTYGALVGCFNYRDTEAFYVVNYDVTKEADVTLNFDNTYHVRVVQDGESKCGNMTGTTMTLKLGAGKAALVVLENEADAQCYYKSVKKADGSYVYQCVHTEGNTGDVHFGTSIIYGDVNGDGKVGASDIIRMKKAMANAKVTVYPGMGDLNGDYKIDMADFDLYRNYIIGKVENRA